MPLSGLEGIVTLPNSQVNTSGIVTELNLAAILKSDFKVSYKFIASEYSRDLNGFEQWCCEQGLLTEINDTDYAEPKLAVIS